MSYVKTLKNGDIPEKKKKTATSRLSTSYDVFMEKKRLSAYGRNKDITVIQPKQLSEVEQLIRGLKENKGFIVDFSAASAGESGRMLDFLSGAVYALDGVLERIGQTMYLMTPKGIDVQNRL